MVRLNREVNVKRRIIIGVLVLALFAAIASGWVFNGHGNSDEPEQTVTLTMPQIVMNDLVIRYGDSIEVRQGPEKVTGEYLTYIVVNNQLKAVMWVNGLMYEVASVSLTTPTPAPETQ